jgi:hypothetical protein
MLSKEERKENQTETWRRSRSVARSGAYCSGVSAQIRFDLGGNGCEESVMLALSLRSIGCEEVVVMGRMEFTLFPFGARAS